MTGHINAVELEKAMFETDHSLEAEEIHKIIKELDYHGNGKINYTEFLAATVSIKAILTHERMWALFK
jgi:Ca2+-binding EF-hand superfamily protein